MQVDGPIAPPAVNPTGRERSALVLGATGLVGSHCLDLLVADDAYSRVVVLARDPLPRHLPKLLWHVVDFDRLAELGGLLRADDVFCCLGTTIRAAGSKEAFARVDFGYVVEAARVAAENGAGQLLLVSAVGADPESRVFYSRVKGQVEQAVRELPFRGVHIFRPSLLLGRRQHPRPRERVAAAIMVPLSLLLVGPARKYRPVSAAALAAAMVAVAKEAPTGVNVFESDRIAAGPAAHGPGAS